MILPRFIGAHIWVLSLYIIQCFCESTQGQGDSMRCSTVQGQTELPHCIVLSRMTSSASTGVIFSLSRKRVGNIFEAYFHYNATSFSRFYDCLTNYSNVECTTSFKNDFSNYSYTAQNTSVCKSADKNQNASSSHVWACVLPERPDNSNQSNIICKRERTEQKNSSQAGTSLLISLENRTEAVQLQWLFQQSTVLNDDEQSVRKILIVHVDDSSVRANDNLINVIDNVVNVIGNLVNVNDSLIHTQMNVTEDSRYCKIPEILETQNNKTGPRSASEENMNPGPIIGAVLGILLVIIVIVVVIIVKRRKINVLEYFSKFTLCQMCPFIKKTSQPSQDAGRLSPYHVGDWQKDENNQTYNSAKSQRKTYEEVDLNYKAGVSANAHTNPDRSMFDDYERISHYKNAKHCTDDIKTISTVPTNITNIIAGSDSSTAQLDSPDYFTNKYSHLHEEETRIPKNPYNVLLKPKVDPKQRQPIEAPSDANIPNQESFKYSVALSIQDVENIRSQPIDVVDTAGTSKGTPSKFRIKEKSGGTEMDGNLDNDPQKEEHKYFELEREDGTADSESDAKNKRRAYFELEKVEEEENSDPSDSYY